MFEQWVKDRSGVDAPETRIPQQQKQEALEDIYARLQSSIARGGEPGVVHMGKRVWKWAAAAVLIVGIGSFLWRMVSHRAYVDDKSDWVVRTTAMGEKSRVVLADGTVVFLNERSRLRFPGSYKGLDKREIELEGEAFFDVAKDPDHPFIVTDGNAMIHVLGTKFNVADNPEDSSVVVAVSEGKVALRDRNGLESAAVPLEHGDAGVWHSGSVVREVTAAIGNYFSWMGDGQLSFDSMTLGEVVVQLRRIYKCRIVFDDKILADRKLTFQYPKKDLYSVLKLMTGKLNMHVLLKDSVYHIQDTGVSTGDPIK